MDVESAAIDTSETSVTQNHGKLNDCQELFHQFDVLQSNFQTRARSLVQKIMETKREKENVEQASTWTITLTDSETQTCDVLHRRWNSDMSLEQDAKAVGKRQPFCSSTDTVQTPIIHLPAQAKLATKTKFTNKLDVWSNSHKRPTENMLLSDLGLPNQPPDFSQSEFNLSSEDHFLKENPKSGGRVRFLSHDDGQTSLNHQNRDNDDETDIGLRNEQYFHSGSWMTLTQSERDISEIDSCLSLNYADCFTDSKPFTSTPFKNRSQLKQSVSFHDLLPSKTTQSLPNIVKLSNRSVGEVSDAKRNSTNRSKRHSMVSMDQKSPSVTINRRSSLTGEMNDGPYVPTAITSLYLGGRVKALHGGHLVVSGVVWYRGKLPGINEDVVGIEIDQVGLGSDGTFQGHRYFRCSAGRGLFVPFRKIIMAWPPSNN